MTCFLADVTILRLQHNAVNAFRDALSESRQRSASAAARGMGLNPPGANRWASRSQEGSLPKTLFLETDSGEEPAESRAEGYGFLSRSTEGMLESPAGNPRYLGEETDSADEFEESAADSGSGPLENGQAENGVGDTVSLEKEEHSTEGSVRVSEGVSRTRTEPIPAERERTSFLKRFSLAIRGLVTDPVAGGNASEALGSDEPVSEDFEFDSPRTKQRPGDHPVADVGSDKRRVGPQSRDVPNQDGLPVVVSTKVSGYPEHPVKTTGHKLLAEKGNSSARWTLLGARHDPDAERWLVATGNDSKRFVRSLSQDLASVAAAETEPLSAGTTGNGKGDVDHKRTPSFDRQQSAYYDAVEDLVPGSESDVEGGSVQAQRNGGARAEKVLGESSGLEAVAHDGHSRVVNGAGDTTDRPKAESSHLDGTRPKGKPADGTPEAEAAQYVLHVKVEGRGGEIVGSLRGVGKGMTLEGLRSLIQERLGEKAPGTFAFLMLDVSFRRHFVPLPAPSDAFRSILGLVRILRPLKQECEQSKVSPL